MEMTMGNRCPNCGSAELVGYADGTLRCKYCGTIAGQTNYNSFGSMASRDVNNISSNYSSGKKNKLITILLAIFLGGFGAQYFYLGEYLLGVICLILSCTGISCIWGIIHGIIILSMSDEEFNCKYNR